MATMNIGKKRKNKPMICLTIHGHFYQPPRENPWSEQIEIQDSASPFHDWNQKINDQCYRPNSVSRVLNNAGRIIQIMNNYEHINFDIGPTLIQWIEAKDPHTYYRILAADKKSIKDNNGHGNGIAQVYNHIIMPLANKKDKITQIKWGMADFTHRFKRIPEGIWLAETAINKETAECLIAEGIKFTVLSPTQALKVRSFGKTEWADVSNSSIDPKKPYRIYLKDKNDKNISGKYLDVFFYDGPISQAVAFEHILKSASAFSNRLHTAIDHNRKPPQLINIGTDGESYGHHEAFGDMCLAYMFFKEIKNTEFTVTNYGNYLAMYPPTDEVVLKNWGGEGTAWSCAHGVGRWYRDCGCSTGAQEGWNQQWRAPLRQSLDLLRDHMIMIFEKESKGLVTNPWDTRDDYINVILNRSTSSIDSFLNRSKLKDLTEKEESKILKLLEGQRNALLMYTSCAWFFADISGIETVQVIKYAARAIQIYQEFTDIDLEKLFLSKLKEAESNLGNGNNGENIYVNWIKPHIISPQMIVNQFGINYLILQKFPKDEICLHSIKVLDKSFHPDEEIIEAENYNLIFLYIETTDKLTRETAKYFSYTVQLDFNNFRSYIKKISNHEDFNKCKTNALKIINQKGNATPYEIEQMCEDRYYTLKDIYMEESQELIQSILEQRTDAINESFINIYHHNIDLIGSAVSLGINLPVQLKFTAELSIEMMLLSELEKNRENFNFSAYEDAFELWRLAKRYKLTINNSKICRMLVKSLTNLMISLQKKYSFETTKDIRMLFKIAKEFDINLESMTAQNIMFELLLNVEKKTSKVINPEKNTREIEEINDMLSIAELLNFEVENYKKQISPFLEHLFNSPEYWP